MVHYTRYVQFSGGLPCEPAAVLSTNYCEAVLLPKQSLLLYIDVKGAAGLTLHHSECYMVCAVGAACCSKADMLCNDIDLLLKVADRASF